MVTIDNVGRVVIPKEIRDELGLEAGETLAVEAEGDRVTLRPVRGGAMQKEAGEWVFRGGEPVSLDEANQLVRDSRDRGVTSVLGTQRTSRGLVRRVKVPAE